MELQRTKMNTLAKKRSRLLCLVTLLGTLQGFASGARSPSRSLLQDAQQSLTVTQAGCECPMTWTYVLNGNKTVELSGCANPDKDAQGSWCPVDPSNCRSFTGVMENNGQAFAYDYCSPTRSRTKSGCLCRSRWFGFETNEDVGTKEYEGICASPDGSNKTPHCFVDPATCNANQLPANEKSTCEGFVKLPVDLNVGKKKTATGCKCIPFKLALGLNGPYKTIDSCANPDNDSKGSWCVVNRTSCPTFYSSFTQGYQSVFYDYCAPVRATTNAGCLCRTLWGPGSKYRDQCANPDGKADKWCTVIPGTCKGQAAGAYDSPVWDFCSAAKKNDEGGIATGSAVGGGAVGGEFAGNISTSPAPLSTGSPYQLSESFNTTGAPAPTKKKSKSFFDRNLGWIVGTIVGVVLLIFFILTVRYLFCGKQEEEQMHTKGLLVPSTPSSKGSQASQSPSASPTHTMDVTAADAIIITTPRTARSDLAKSHDSGKFLTGASDEDDLADQDKKRSRRKGDTALEVFVRRPSRRRGDGGHEADEEKGRGEKRLSELKDKRGSGGRSRKDKDERDAKGRKMGKLDGEEEAGFNEVDLRDSRDGFAPFDTPGSNRIPDNFPDSNSYATKSFSKAASPVSKPAPPVDWQSSINPKRSRAETSDTPVDLRLSIANALQKLTGKGKKEDGDSPGTPKPTVPVQEAWEVYARTGNNRNAGSNRWATLPASDQADLLHEHGGVGSARASSDPSASQGSARSSMLQSLLWMPRAKSWGMDFLQWKVPEAFTRSSSGDNVLKLGTIQSQDAMRVTPLPTSAKSNRVSVSLDDIVESPTTSPPAGIPPRASSGKLRGSGSSSEGGSARFLLDSAKRRLLGIKDTAPSAPIAGGNTENQAAAMAGSNDNVAISISSPANGGTYDASTPPAAGGVGQPSSATTNSSWQMWSGHMGSSHRVQSLLESSPTMGLKSGVETPSVYATAEMVSAQSGAFTAHTAHSTWGESPSSAMAGPQEDKSLSSYNSAVTHFEPWQAQGSASPFVQPAGSAAQWPTPGLQNPNPGAPIPHRVDSTLLAKLLETESSSAATPVTIGQMVGSPHSSLDAHSPLLSGPAQSSAALASRTSGSKSEFTAAWAAASLKNRTSPPSGAASPSHNLSATRLSASSNSLKERILAEAAATALPTSPLKQELAAAVLAASTASYKAPSTTLKDQIIAAASSGSFAGSFSNVNTSASSVNEQTGGAAVTSARHTSPLRRDVSAAVGSGSMSSNAGVSYVVPSPAKPRNVASAAAGNSASFAASPLRDQIAGLAMSARSSAVGSISVGGGSLKEQIVAAAAAAASPVRPTAVVAASGGAARPNSIYTTQVSGSASLGDQPVMQAQGSATAPTQSSWSRVKSSGGPTLAGQPAAAPTSDTSNPVIASTGPMPDWKAAL